MFAKVFQSLKNFDWIIFTSVALLMCFGLVEIYSIALSRDETELTNLKKQAIFVLIGLVFLFLISFIDYHNIINSSYYLYVIGIIVLIAVLFVGRTSRGTTGWFAFGGFTIQPVEFVKVILIIFLSKYYSSVSVKLNPIKHLLISGIASAILIGLVILQPDFGSALLLFFVWGIMMVYSGFKKRYLAIIAILLVTIFLTGWLYFFKDYQKQRIMTFINPSSDSLNEGYNVIQATIAVGAGGLIGRGVGFGSQSQLKFLPESQNDFIFAVIAEELGFLGVCLVIGFYCLLFFKMLSHIPKVNNDFGIYYILGTTSLLFIEMFVNIGMNLGLLPVVGISLPFISYGGSVIVSSLIMIGIVQSIIIKSKIKY